MGNWRMAAKQIAWYAVMPLLIFSAGVYAGYRYFAPPLQAALADTKTEASVYKGQLAALNQTLANEKNKPPQIVTETRTQTKIAYVPKETIVYRDAKTGEIVAGKEPVDADITVAPPTINLRYNGRDYAMPGLTGETAKFQGGKLLGEITTTAAIDVSALVNEQIGERLTRAQKHVSLGGYVTNQGFVASVGVVNRDLEYKLIGKVPQLQKFYGGGVEFKF